MLHNQFDHSNNSNILLQHTKHLISNHIQQHHKHLQCSYPNNRYSPYNSNHPNYNQNDFHNLVGFHNSNNLLLDNKQNHPNYNRLHQYRWHLTDNSNKQQNLHTNQRILQKFAKYMICLGQWHSQYMHQTLGSPNIQVPDNVGPRSPIYNYLEPNNQIHHCHNPNNLQH